jgi:hypothetical protein
VPAGARPVAAWAPHDPPAADQHDHGGWAAWASASVVCWAIWLATVLSGGGLSGLWPVWVSVPWGGVLLAGELTGGRHALPGGRSGDSGRTGRRAREAREAREAQRARRGLRGPER